MNGDRSSVSVTSVAAPALAIPEVGAAPTTHRPSVWAILRRKPLGAAYGAIIVLLVLTAVFAPLTDFIVLSNASSAVFSPDTTRRS